MQTHTPPPQTQPKDTALQTARPPQQSTAAPMGTAPHAPKRFPLTWRMIHMLLLCWVLPITCCILLGGNVLRQSLMEQSMERLSLSVQGASQMTSLRIENAIVASRNASYIGTIKSAWSTYQTDGNQVALYETSRTFLSQQYDSEETFYSTILLFYEFEDDPIYIINGAAGGTDRVRQSADEIFATAQEIGQDLGTGIAFFSAGERVFMMRNLVDSNYQPIAILMMELNTDLIFAEFSALSNTELAIAGIGGVAVTITSEDPADSVRVNADTALATLQEMGEQLGDNGMEIVYQDGAMHTALVVSGTDYSYTFYSVTHPAVLDQQWDMVVALLLLIFLLMLPLGALVFRFFTLHVTRPIQVIMSAANKLEQGVYGVQVPREAFCSQEIGDLGDNFNEVSLTLQRQFEHIYKEEIALRDARIMALQSQINPHFLNNTLEIINWEARMQGDLKVCNMLESLSTMLNAAMDRRNRPTVSLSEELMYVDAYLYIIRERLGQRLVFEKDIPADLLDVRVPRLVLQPILENAVEHGITPAQKGCIVLRAQREGDWLILSVENDGGLNEAQQQRIEALLRGEQPDENLGSNSLGLRNVHQRLRILYGEESGIIVDITKNDVTVFKLKVRIDQL